MNAEVPLANMSGGVGAGFERFGERDLGWRQTARGIGKEHAAVSRHPAPQGITAREERGAARCADFGAGVKIGEPHALGGHAIDIRRADRRAAIAPEITVTLVVGKNNNDVRAGRCGRRRQLDGEHEQT